MIVTTTPGVEGKRIVEYKGIVFGEVISGVDFLKDFAASLSDFFGGRSRSYEGELMYAREEALERQQQHAHGYSIRYGGGSRVSGTQIVGISSCH